MIRLALMLLFSFGLWAQRAISVEDLVKFVTSSLTLKHSDKQVADFLGKIKLNHQLSQSVIDDLQGLGAGPRTFARLKELRAESSNLPLPPAPVQKQIAVPLAGPSDAEAGEIVEKIRQNAIDYSSQLPDFVCVQVTRRYFDPAGAEAWSLMDTVVTRLGLFEGREDYKLVSVNGKPTLGMTMEQLGGTTSSGEFGSLLKDIFRPSAAVRFKWERWATLRGKRMHVFSYDASPNQVPFTITYEKTQTIVAGSKGLIYSDRESHQVMRIVHEAAAIPPDFPIQEVSRTLDYDFQEISSSNFLVPLRADIRSRSGKLLTRNAVEFRLYQKFGVETQILDAPDPLPDDKTKEQAPSAAPAANKPVKK